VAQAVPPLTAQPVDDPRVIAIGEAAAKLACHRFWNDIAGLAAAAGTLLDQIDAHFHTDDRPAIHLVKDLCESAKWSIR